ncbi:response regulator transcription factor [Streptomyces sp. R28]|uniref:Response regulator transcription factor n=1 Tax=Streptomyces sp. R28 TaxID=3238628 RepID=A0AB39Q054_9ACTN
MPAACGIRQGTVRVLIVDDEPELTELLSWAVAEAGWQPFLADDGRGALTLARSCAPHAVVLDWMLPDLDGVQVLRRLRYENARLPVLMLTARDALEHRLDGLSAGAEHQAADEPVRVLGDLVLAEKARQVQRDGTPIALTAKEFDLLHFLMRHAHQVLSKAQILGEVWNSSFDSEGNLVEVYIYGLRAKIDKGRAPMIHTVRGAGYVIRAADSGR